MTAPDDLLTISTWPQAFVAIAILAAFVIWPGVLAWLNSRKANTSTEVIRKTLTENNNGSHVKDKLDHLVEGMAGLQGWRDEHVGWAEETFEKIAQRLSGVEDTGNGNTELIQQVLDRVNQVEEVVTAPKKKG